MCCQQPPGEAQTRCRGSVLRVSEGPCVSRVAAHPKAAMVFGNCSLQPTLPKGDDEDLNGAVPRCALQTWGLASSPCQAVEPLALLIHHNCSQRRSCRISPGRIPLPALRPYSISYLTETSRVHSGAHGVSPASSTWCRPHRDSRFLLSVTVPRVCPAPLPRPLMVTLDGPDPALTPAALCSLLTSHRSCPTAYWAWCTQMDWGCPSTRGAAATPALHGGADPLSPGVSRSSQLGAVGHWSL